MNLMEGLKRVKMVCPSFSVDFDIGGVLLGGNTETKIVDKNLEDLPTPPQDTSALAGTLPVVDAFLPDHLWKYRHLIRSHDEFTFYSDKVKNLPGGYQWFVLGRIREEVRPSPVQVEALFQELCQLVDA
jgi:hypothetical protein